MRKAALTLAALLLLAGNVLADPYRVELHAPRPRQENYRASRISRRSPAEPCKTFSRVLRNARAPGAPLKRRRVIF